MKLRRRELWTLHRDSRALLQFLKAYDDIVAVTTTGDIDIYYDANSQYADGDLTLDTTDGKVNVYNFRGKLDIQTYVSASETQPEIYVYFSSVKTCSLRAFLCWADRFMSFDNFDLIWAVFSRIWAFISREITDWKSRTIVGNGCGPTLEPRQ